MRVPSLFLALAGALAAGDAAANAFSITPDISSGNFNTYKWTIAEDGGAAQSNPTLTLIVGQTYTFTANTSVVHPFWIKTVQEALGSAGAYPTGGSSGLDANGATSSATPLTFTPPASAAGTLYYNCGNHASMTGVINVVIDPVFANGFEP